MQEQGGLVQQAFRRLHALHHDAARHGVKLRFFVRRKFAPREDHDGNVGKRVVLAELLEQIEARDIGQPEIEHDAIDRLLAQYGERLRAGARGQDLDIVVAEQFANAHLLGRIVLHDQQAFAPRPDIFLHLAERSLHALHGRRLGDEREGARGQAVLTVLVQGHDLNRDVPCQRILLELVEHRPAQHVGKENVERHRRWPVFQREFERILAARCDQNLESLVMRKIHHDARVVRIVLHDQQGGIAGLDVVAVVGNLFDHALGLGRRESHSGACRCLRRRSAARRSSRRHSEPADRA